MNDLSGHLFSQCIIMLLGLAPSVCDGGDVVGYEFAIYRGFRWLWAEGAIRLRWMYLF